MKDIDDKRFLFQLDDTGLVDKFSERFPEFKEYTGKVDPRKVIQFIILLSDLHSSLRTDTPDFFQRKYKAAMLCKFPTSKKEFTKDAEQIVVGENEAVNRTMVAYIMSYGKPEYSLLVSFMALLSFETQKALTGEGTKDTAKNIEFIANKVKALTKDFFSSGDQDEYSLVRSALYARIEKEQIRLRPEMVIRQLEEDGALPADWNPHGAGYVIDPSKDMVFIGDKEPKKK
jgi:hypothetical protein